MRGCSYHTGGSYPDTCEKCRLESRIAAQAAELEQKSHDLEGCNLSLEESRAEVARLREELQKAERIWVIDRDARSADERALATERAAREALADLVGQALVVPTLEPGEELSEPKDHALISVMLEMRAAREKAEADLAKLRATYAIVYRANEQGRSERDTALNLAREHHANWKQAQQLLLEMRDERDTALARVKEEKERADFNFTAEKLCREGYDRRLQSAESALASARKKLDGLMLAIEDNYGECAEGTDDLVEVDGLIDAYAIYEDLKELRDHLVAAPSPAPCSGCASLNSAIDQAIRDMLSGGHPFEKGVAKAINDMRAAQKAGTAPAPCSGCEELKAKLERARTILTSKRVLNPQSQVARALGALR